MFTSQKEDMATGGGPLVGRSPIRRGLPGCRSCFRALYDTAVVLHGRTRDKKPTPDRGGEFKGACRSAREVAELDRFSSASSDKVQNARDLSDRGSSHQPNELREGEIKQLGDGRNIHRTSHSNNEQPSIVPVITRETTVKHIDDDYQVSPAWQELNDSTCRLILPKKITEDHLSSASTFEIMFHRKQDRKCFAQSTQPLGREVSGSYLDSKRVLQQRKQLLFDCVKEVIETYRKKDRSGKNKNANMEPDEIGKIICEKIVGWGRTRGNETSIGELLYLEFLETVEEWEDCVRERMQVSLKIGDALMEDVINGIVADLICN